MSFHRLLRNPILVAIAALLLTHSVLGQPSRLESVDPLASPAPAFEVEIVDLYATQSPEEKIVPRLWQRMTETGEKDEISVIVELRSAAEGRVGAASLTDDERQRHAAAIEHQFAARAGHLIRDLRGLSHFPIIFGRAYARDLEALAAQPAVHRIYEDEVLVYFRAEGGNLIKATNLRTGFGATGAGVAVAIVDSGVDGTHPELASRILVEGDFTGTTGNGTIDDVGHGTGVGGIVAGVAGGVAPQANLWAIKVGTAEGLSTSSVLAGLNGIYAARNDFGGVDVVNLSLGSRGPFPADCDGITPYNPILNQLFAAGILVVVASGNDGDTDGIGDPACHSKVIAVGAVYDGNIGSAGFPDVPGQGGSCTDSTTAADRITCYSNSGPPLDVLAPSHCARTPQPGGGYNNCFGGTSAAAPYVAGVAAQLLQLHPGLTPTQLRDVLMTTGKPITDVNAITRSRIDALAAHQALSGGGPTGPCVEDSTTACLLGGRFKATVRFRAGFDNLPADTSALRKPVTGFANPFFETVFFYFNSVDNIEILLKMLDQGNTNAQGQPTIAVLLGSATPLRTEVTIVDTQTGASRTFTSEFNSMRGSTDFTAFVK